MTCSLPFLTSWLKVGIVFLLSSRFLPGRFSSAGARTSPVTVQSTQLVIIAKEKGDVKNFLCFSQKFFSFFGCFDNYPGKPQDVVFFPCFFPAAMVRILRRGNFLLAFCSPLYYCCIRKTSLFKDDSVPAPVFSISSILSNFLDTSCAMMIAT